jgi:hypothetical protein
MLREALAIMNMTSTIWAIVVIIIGQDGKLPILSHTHTIQTECIMQWSKLKTQ